MIAFRKVLASTLLVSCLSDCSSHHDGICPDLLHDEVAFLQVGSDIVPGSGRKSPRKPILPRGVNPSNFDHGFGIPGGLPVHPGLGGPADAPQLLGGGNSAMQPVDKQMQAAILGGPDAILHAATAFNDAAKIAGSLEGGSADAIMHVPPEQISQAANALQQVANDASGNPALMTAITAAMSPSDQAQVAKYQTISQVGAATAAGTIANGANAGASMPMQQAQPAQIIVTPEMQKQAQIKNTAAQIAQQQEISNYQDYVAGNSDGGAPSDTQVGLPIACPISHLYLNNGQGDGTFWRCVDGTCIVNKGRCDGNQNCADGSDELYCNKQLFKRVNSLEAKNSELQDQILGLRTGGAERLAEFNTLNVMINSLNQSLRSDFNSLRKTTQPHLKLQGDLESLRQKSTDLQAQFEGLKTHDKERVEDVNTILGKNSALVGALDGLKQQNEALKKEVELLKQDYVKLQVQIQNGAAS